MINYHKGERMVLVQSQNRRKEMARLLPRRADNHANETVIVARDNAGTHQDDVIEAVVSSSRQ